MVLRAVLEVLDLFEQCHLLLEPIEVNVRLIELLGEDLTTDVQLHVFVHQIIDRVAQVLLLVLGVQLLLRQLTGLLVLQHIGHEALAEHARRALALLGGLHLLPRRVVRRQGIEAAENVINERVDPVRVRLGAPLLLVA